MIKNYLLITIRNLMKSKFFIFVNVLGMSIAIASCIVAFFNYDFNEKFDRHHVNASTIYRINSHREFQGNVTSFGFVPFPLSEATRQNTSDLEAMTRYNSGGLNLRVKEELFDTGIDYVDPDFFQMFSYEFISGSADAIRDKSKILISEELALKFFGDEPALGKIITQPTDSINRDFEVGGVFKEQPFNSSFSNQAIINIESFIDQNPASEKGQNWRWRVTLFVQAKDPSRIPVIESQLKQFTENNNRVREDFIIKEFKLDPFVGMAVRDMQVERPGTWTREAVPKAAVVGTAMMGGLVLLIACFNLTNTAIAVSSRRLKEIGIRKVVGGLRAGLIIQFIGETMLICFAALLIGIGLAELFLIPAFNDMWSFLKIETDYFGNPAFMMFLVGILFFTGLLAGSYPAFYISRFNPVVILKGKVKFGGTNYFTLILLGLQLAISLIAVVSSVAFIQNARYQREFDLGFEKKNVVFAFVDNYSEYEAYRNELVKNPEITNVSGSPHHFFYNFFNDPIKHAGKEIEVDIMEVGDDYLKTMGITLLEGRDFVKDSETDRRESVIITEELARKFGWSNPIGQQITWMDTVQLYVVGMIKDVYNRGMWDPLEPIMIRYGVKDKYSFVLVSAPAHKIIEINKFMEETWNKLFPNRLYTGRYMDEEMAEAATVNNNILKMFLFLGVVAVMLSATGLFTLVSLNIIKKMKEIGVRKVLGASISNIAKVVNIQFAIVLLIASALGSIAGAYLTDALMGSIWNFYQSANTITFVIAVIVLFAISLVTVGFKIYSTANMNPVNVLRDE